MSERYEKGREPVTYQSPSDSLIAYVLEHNPDFISFKDLCSLYFREKKVLKSLILQKKKSERKD